ncbi:MAG: pyridoxamine 5'-phosphate oxidase family protein [Chitinivibrionales bacterium]|nr:pyridoxamine 5'-phosphate oxidase family protein [Chitinivibrionales bacterium]
MDLARYFEEHDGIGVLATCDPDSLVDAALYGKPAVIDENTVAFIMKEYLSHKNLKANLHAAYLFIEKTGGYRGIRLHLTMTREEDSPSLIASIQKKQPEVYPENDASGKYVVFFQVDRIRPLVGNGPAA